MSLTTFIDARITDPFPRLNSRQADRDEQTELIVAQIIDDVRKRGDAALLESGRRFDSSALNSILVTEEELASAEIPERHLRALQLALHRVQEFHTLQLAHFTQGLEPQGKSFGWSHNHVGQKVAPLQSAGVYVPGGKATYPSSVLMNSIPAKVAGVVDRYVATPCRSDGTLAPSVLTALRLTDTRKAFKVGGASAVAAFAFGTETVPRVDKIVGPGNRFVNEAKRQLWGKVGLDGYAGPSEVCVLVDDSADAEWAAADLLTQIEHSEDNAAFLVSTDEAKLKQVLAATERQLVGAACENSMRTALANESLAILAADLSQAIDIVNAIAPEHLTVSIRNPEGIVDRIQNAGCILLGDFTPECAGDFVLGPSHTLPTARAARFGSPVNVLDFLKVQSVSYLKPDQLLDLIPAIEAFGEMEGFPTHARGASIRLAR